MDQYIATLFSIFSMVNKQADQKKDKKMKYIALIIYNYLSFMAKENNIDLNHISIMDTIQLAPFFDYVAFYHIDFYDFSKIQIEDVDISKKEDLERFVLSHIYYITK